MMNYDLTCAKRIVIAVFCGFCSAFQVVSSKCPSPPVYLGNSYNGTKDTLYPLGTVLTYSCLIGFDPKDEFSKTRICLIDGSWTGDNGVCKLNVFNFFISLLATVGVIIVFIFLVACRVFRQRKRGSTHIKHKRKHASSDSTHPLSDNSPTTNNIYESTTIAGHVNEVGVTAMPSQHNGTTTQAFGTEQEMEGPPIELPERTTHNPSYGVQFDEKSNKLHQLAPGGELEVNDAGYKVSAKHHIPYTLQNTPSYRKQGTGWIHDDASFDSYDDDDDDGDGKAPNVDVTL